MYMLPGDAVYKANLWSCKFDLQSAGGFGSVVVCPKGKIVTIS